MLGYNFEARPAQRESLSTSQWALNEIEHCIVQLWSITSYAPSAAHIHDFRLHPEDFA
jgi:hypothetical protein